MPNYHENHLCANCGYKYGQHAGHGNPHVPQDTCPTGKFPKWPTALNQEQSFHAAGIEFDSRVEKFWKASKSTFKPRS